MADKKAVKTTTSGFTKEEELLLNDFSRNVSTKSSALFYGNALIVSAIPICKYRPFRLSRRHFSLHGYVDTSSLDVLFFNSL